MASTGRIAARGGALLLVLLPIACGAGSEAVPGAEAPPWNPPAGLSAYHLTLDRGDLGADPEPFYWHGEACPPECGAHASGWHAYSPVVGPELVTVGQARLGDGRIVLDVKGPEPDGLGARAVLILTASKGSWSIEAAGLRQVLGHTDHGYAPRPEGRVTVDPRSVSPGGPLILELDLESARLGLVAQGRLVLEEVRPEAATSIQAFMADAELMEHGAPSFPDPSHQHGDVRGFGIEEGIDIARAELDVHRDRLSSNGVKRFTERGAVEDGTALVEVDVVRLEGGIVSVRADPGEPWFERPILYVRLAETDGAWTVEWVTVFLAVDYVASSGWAASLEGSVRYDTVELEAGEAIELQVDVEGRTRWKVDFQVYAELLVDPSEAR